MTTLSTLLSGSWSVVLVAVLAGPLVAAGAAKLVTPPDRLAWPIATGPLRPPHGPRLVGAAELAAAAAIVLLPGRGAALVALIAYAALTAAAVVTRGSDCACFGMAHLAAVGRAHIGFNAGLAGVAAALLTVSAAAVGPVPRLAVALAAAAVTAGVVVVLDRRRARASATVTCTSKVSSVQLYVSDDCPSCRSLKKLLLGVEPERQATIVTTVVAKDAEMPGALRGLGVPCAQGLGADGTPVCEPVSGIGGVKALVDSVTIRPTAVLRAG